MAYIKGLYQCWLKGLISDREYISLVRKFLSNKFRMEKSDAQEKITQIF